MKNYYKKIMLSCVFALTGLLSYAQDIIYTYNNTTAQSCDGYAVIDDTIYSYTNFVWMEGNTTLSSTLSYAPSLCPGTYTVTCSGSDTYSDTTITFTIGVQVSCAGFEVFITQQNVATVCDGALTAGVVGGTPPYSYQWSNGATTAATLNNLCNDTVYSVAVTDANGCMLTLYSSLQDSTISGSPCNNSTLQVHINSIQASSPTTCDAEAMAYASNGATPYVYSWSNGATGTNISGICPSAISVTVTDAQGCTVTAWTSLYSDTNFVDSSLVVYTYPISTSEDGVCDGKLDVYAVGYPVQFVLSNGASNTTGYFDSLCQGIYTLTVYDINGDTVYVDVIISNPSNNHNNNNNYGDSLYVDSILGNLQENCQLNYQDIDSAYISYYFFVGDSIYVNWNVVTGSGSTIITQGYYLGGGAGVYGLGLQVYCPHKSLGNYLTATDFIYFSGIAAGVKENTLGDISVYPNPATDKIRIQFEKPGKYQAVLYDLTGREMTSMNSGDADYIQLNVSEFAQGQYVLKISGNNGFITRSIVK